MSFLSANSRSYAPNSSLNFHNKLYGVQMNGTRAMPRRQSRTSIVVEANFFSRISRITRSFIDGVISSAEDPEKILEQAVQDMQADLIKMRQASASVISSQKMVETKYKQLKEQEADWEKRAELALMKGEEELAREALKRKQGYAKNAESLQAQLEQQKAAAEQVVANTRMLETKLAEAKSKKDTLRARAASAKTSQQIQEMVGSLDSSSSVAAFEKMEEKVMAMESQAEAAGMLAAGDELEQKFDKLQSTSVDDELAQMKSKMLKGETTAPKALPEGTPVKDAIDAELEALRKKVQG